MEVVNIKIVVLAGGLSPERDVSLSSGSLIANALREVGHHVVLVDVYVGISNVNKNLNDLFEDSTGKPYKYIVPEVEPNLEELKRNNNNRNSLIGPNVLELCKLADITFLALHGAMGENGQIQATFDILDIKYTGTGYVGSLLAMEKDISKKLLYQECISTPKWITYKGDKTDIENIINIIGLPCVVKPCSGGSSIGVAIVNTLEDLINAIKAAEKIEAKIIVEEMISGREFSVGILNNKALPVIEIIPKEGFYDYKNKYQANLTDEICPANLSEIDTLRVQEAALKIHKVLQLGSYSRIDFILNNSGEFYCLEANTLPGMTPTSLLPQEAMAAGISYAELCDYIVQLAMNSD